jgi:hypothetical protein
MSYIENNVPTKWQVTLDSFTCGGGSIFSPKVLAANNFGDQTPAPQPPEGQQFCLAKFSVINESNSNQPWMAYEATVNVGMNAYSSQVGGPGYDAEQAYMQAAQPSGDTSDFGINPGVHAVSWGVWEIPVQDQPTSVGVPDGNTEQVLVKLT